MTSSPETPLMEPFCVHLVLAAGILQDADAPQVRRASVMRGTMMAASRPTVFPGGCFCGKARWW